MLRLIQTVPVFQSGIPEPVLEVIRAYVWLLYPLCFVAFFAATALALAFHQRQYVKRTYIAGLLSLLIVINLVGWPVLPIMTWHKFSEPAPQEQTRYDFRLADTNGDEISYPGSAMLSVDGVTFRHLEERMFNDFSCQKNQRIARYMIQRAQAHRDVVQNRSPLHYLRFPPHGLFESSWNEATLQSYSQFVTLRMYRIDLLTSADGTELTNYSETQIYEVNLEQNATTCIDKSTVGDIALQPLSDPAYRQARGSL